ncbi:unnamed protein product [Vitrella brassicaformis CCMP3155]|uniref:Endonuclease/exonuclease/phosphatase domain-containing protein n=1 Tax=Vitrella brassicaformis (strain CCMP3155) TaxID=1169540 RepID=A0A0G4G9A8_VITBC|nr:unnamed protein product [Vitrella brassicaformis CCMP3155]|eukprot:CEM25159.1 unnamed protein product [Vitrella brassicaformis CCMP3155]
MARPLLLSLAAVVSAVCLFTPPVAPASIECEGADCPVDSGEWTDQSGGSLSFLEEGEGAGAAEQLRRLADDIEATRRLIDEGVRSIHGSSRSINDTAQRLAAAASLVESESHQGYGPDWPMQYDPYLHNPKQHKFQYDKLVSRLGVGTRCDALICLRVVRLCWAGLQYCPIPAPEKLLNKVAIGRQNITDEGDFRLPTKVWQESHIVIMQLNAEWTWPIEYYKQICSDPKKYRPKWMSEDSCECAWYDKPGQPNYDTAIKDHYKNIARVIEEHNPDIVHLVELGDCNTLYDIRDAMTEESKAQYRPFMVQQFMKGGLKPGPNPGGKERFPPFGNHHCGVLSKVNLWAKKTMIRPFDGPGDRLPDAMSGCGHKPSPNDKIAEPYRFWYARFNLDDIKVGMIGLHLKAIPKPDPPAHECSQREAEAIAVSDFIENHMAKKTKSSGYPPDELIIIGDFNDYETPHPKTGEPFYTSPGKAKDYYVPNSRTLPILRQGTGTRPLKYRLANAGWKVPRNYRGTSYWDVSDEEMWADKPTHFQDGGPLDHILVTKNLYKAIRSVEVVSTYRPVGGGRCTDHFGVKMVINVDWLRNLRGKPYNKQQPKPKMPAFYPLRPQNPNDLPVCDANAPVVKPSVEFNKYMEKQPYNKENPEVRSLFHSSLQGIDRNQKLAEIDAEIDPLYEEDEYTVNYPKGQRQPYPLGGEAPAAPAAAEPPKECGVEDKAPDCEDVLYIEHMAETERKPEVTETEPGKEHAEEEEEEEEEVKPKHKRGRGRGRGKGKYTITTTEDRREE